MKKNLLLLSVAMLAGTIVFASDGMVSLNGRWELSFWEQPAKPVRTPEGVRVQEKQTIPATVPGNVELDMIAAGIYKRDLTVDNNVSDVLPYECYQWCYTRTFTAPELKAGQRLDIYFGGVDCLADIWINDRYAGSTDNMMIAHTFDIGEFVENGKENTVYVIIRSVLAEVQEYAIGVLPFRSSTDPATVDFLPIRRAVYLYGCSIFPRIVSGSIFRDVELRVTDPVSITDVYWYTAWMDTRTGSAEVCVDYQCRLPVNELRQHKVEFTLRRKGQVVVSRTAPLRSHAGRQRLRIENTEYWWPRGYGEAALYDGEVRIIDENGNTLDSNVRPVGVRQVRLELSEVATQENPGRFCLFVNGEPIFVRGTNWVPVDVFCSRERELLPDILNMIADLNCNMVRVWGGGIYEDEMFYDYCDRNGIMVWQDFMFACTMYPQDDDFAGKVEREIRSTVIRLRNHPSIALWCGNNESDRSLLWQSSGLGIDPNRDRISRRTIPDVLYEFDPTRPYLPSSPYHTPASIPLGQNDYVLPETHLWSSAYYKDNSYTGVNSPFVSEVGYHGIPGRESLAKMFDPQFVDPWDANGRWNREWLTKWEPEFTKQVTFLFGDYPRQLDKFITASQITQAEGYKYFIEFWRGAKFDRSGIIWWNLRDGWPILSNAVVDYYNSKKLAYHYIKNVQRDVCVMMHDPRDGFYPLIAVNDTRAESGGKVVVSDVASGKIIFEGDYTVPANGRSVIARLPAIEGQGMLLIKYSVSGRKFSNHYLYGKPPFSQDDYTKWYTKAAIYPE